MNSQSRRLLCVLVLGVTLIAPARGDEIAQQLDLARQSYAAGELRRSLEALQFAIAGIQEKIGLALLELLPKPLEDWSADEAQAQSGGIAAMITGTQLRRRYFRSNGQEVEIEVSADSPMLPMLSMMLSNPLIAQATPGSRLYTFGGHRGTLSEDKEAGIYEITLLIDNRILLRVTANGVPDRTPAESYLKAIDLAALSRALAR